MYNRNRHKQIPGNLIRRRRQIDAEPSDTVGVLKSRIETEQGHAVSGQKLIYSGEDGLHLIDIAAD